jgi:WD40 repeat protein
MKNMKKKIAGLLIVCAIAIFSIVSIGRTNYKAYYSGDAVNYQGNLIIASTDSGNLEVFKLEGSLMERMLKFKAPNSPIDKTDDFSSVKLNVENGSLFAYATSGYTLYKYDLTNLDRPVVTLKQKNTYYEWYNRVDKFGSAIVTVSDKSIKVWRTDSLDVIDSFKIESDVPSSVGFDASGKYISYINKDNVVRIFDTKTRSISASFPVNYRGDKSQRKTYFDPVAKELFVFDDYYLKRYDVNGNLLVSFPNSSANGYAVEPAGDYSYVYVVNGDSIMKLAKDNLKSGIKVSATRMSSNGYAMGLKYVDVNGRNDVVVFNGGGITVLDSSLNKIASLQASEIAEQPEVKENLALSFDHYLANPGATAVLSGAGYLPGEDLIINFGGTITNIKADRNGRFNQSLTVPGFTTKTIDAKVDGVTSKLTYSVSFQVSKTN